jgi:hypothetical protein
MKNDTNAAANAFASAFVADIESAPLLKAALVSRKLDRNGLVRIVARDLEAFQRGSRAPALFPNVRKVTREFVDQERRTSPGMAGLGQWDIIANVVGAAAGAAANIYSAVTNTAIQKDLLKLQQQKAQTEIQIAQMQANAAQVQLAAANAAAGQASANTFTLAPSALGPAFAGIPLLPVAAGIALAAAATYHFVKR